MATINVISASGASEEGATSSGLRLEQRSRYLEYLPWAVLNAALVIATFNLYLFWAKSNVRRYLWSTTWIGSRPLTYSGNGRELAVGFAASILLATAALGLPLAVLVTEFTQQIRSTGGVEDIQLTGNRLVDLVILLVIPVSWSVLALLVEFLPEMNVATSLVALSGIVAVVGWFYALCVSRHMAFRYLLRHTVWQGCNGDIPTSPWRYGGRMLLPELSRWLTLGWTGPWRYVLRWDRLLNGARFGAGAFAFRGAARKLYPRFALVWLTLLVAGWILSSVVSAYADAGSAHVGTIANGGSAVLFLVTLLAVAWYDERVYRHVAESLSLGELRFRFEGSWVGLARLYLTNLVMNVFSAGLAYYYTRLRITRFVVRNLVIEGNPQSLIDSSADEHARAREHFGEGLEALVAASYV